MFFDWFQKVGGQGEAIWASLPSSLPGGCDRRTRSATAYHVPDGILTFSGSEGENGGKKLWWEKMALVGEMCQEWYELPLLLRQGWCFHANAAPVHMVASWVTSRSVQNRYLLGHRELNHGNSLCTEPVLIPLTSPLHSDLIWGRLFTKQLSSQLHNSPAHHAWRFIFNHLPRILQTTAHKTNTSHVSHLLG